ncbi:unnamed protein product [Calypogeia fissa]
MSAKSGGHGKAHQTMDVELRELRELLHGRDVQISTLKQHLALLTSDFKYNLKLLEDRDFELDQCEAQLGESEKRRTLKVKEIDLLALEIANLRSIGDRDSEQIQELETTLSQYKESVRSVRERLEEALQLRDQELTCHRSELEALQTKLQQQTESLKLQEKGLGDAMKACERTWSQRYSECHKTVMTLVSEQDGLLKEKLEKDKEIETMQERARELQKTSDELSQVADARKKEIVGLTHQLETVQGRMSGRLGELEQAKQDLEGNLRKRILEEYDGKIAELLAQLQSIEYAVSLERREAHTRFITMEAQHSEQISVLHQTVQDLRRERDAMLEKVAKLEKEMSSLKGSLSQVRTHETRLSEREATLTEEVTTLQDALHDAQTLLEKSEVEKTREIALLHEFLRESRAKEHVLSKSETEHTKRINILEKSLGEVKSKVEKLSKKESEQSKEIITLQDAFTEAKVQKDAFFKKNAEHVKEIATLKKSLLEAKNQIVTYSKKHTEYAEEFTNLQQALIEARNQGEMLSQKNDNDTKKIADLKHNINEAKAQEILMRKKLEDQAKQIVELQESFQTAKAEGELLLKAEASHAEEICVLRKSLVETQKQAEAARNHAKHLDAILEVTQVESRRRVEIQESVSCLITGSQDVQALDLAQDSTTIEYSAPPRFPDGSSGSTCSDQINNCQAVWSAKDAEGFGNGLDQRTVRFSPGKNNLGLKDGDSEPHLAVEKENRFLKARVEELEAENVKVGQVISDLRHELETAGVLQRFRGFSANVDDEILEQDKLTQYFREGPSLPRRPDLERKAGLQQVKGTTVVCPPEHQSISVAEKEELQVLRSMMKDAHGRNARFHKQVDPINVQEETSKHKPGEKNLVSFSEDDLREEENEHKYMPGNRHNNTSSSHRAGLAHGPTRVNSQGIPCESHGALTVSAEVLKLNEQIARVRQQLTSLCSTDQTDPSPSPGSVERSRPKTKSMHFDILPSPHQPISDSYETFKARNLTSHDQKISAFRNTSSTCYRESCEQERASAKSSKGQENQHSSRKPSLNWADMSGALLGKTRHKQEQSIPAREVCSSSDYPLRMRKEKLATRPSARDSLGTSRLRIYGNKRLKIRVPSVASSRSDNVCTHCQRYITDEENEIDLRNSTPEMSNNPSPKLQNKRSHCIHEPTKHWRDFRNGGGLDSSTASEERDAAHRSLHKCQQKVNPHGLPELAGRWSDESDMSRPSGSALPRQCASVPTAHGNSHSAPRKPWLKTRDRRGSLQQEKGVQRPQLAKDEPQGRKVSGTILKKKGTVGITSKVVRKEKAFPANLRENIHSHQPELSQFRVLTSHPAKVPL